MSNEKYAYLKKMAQKHNTRFLRCEGVLYEVTSTSYPTGPSPLWSVDIVRPVDVPPFATEPKP